MHAHNSKLTLLTKVKACIKRQKQDSMFRLWQRGIPHLGISETQSFWSQALSKFNLKAIMAVNLKEIWKSNFFQIPVRYFEKWIGADVCMQIWYIMWGEKTDNVYSYRQIKAEYRRQKYLYNRGMKKKIMRHDTCPKKTHQCKCTLPTWNC